MCIRDSLTLCRQSGLIERITAEANAYERVLGGKPVVLGDLGYLGLANDYPQSIIPHKRPKNGDLTEQQKSDNHVHSKHRIIVENYFGRMKTLWSIMHQVYRLDLSTYDRVFDLWAALTNFISGLGIH